MAGLLSGLEAFGLKNLDNMEVFEKEESKKSGKNDANAKKAPEVLESDFLFDKTYECPVCGKTLKSRTLRAGKAKLIGTDLDIRPRYEHIEPIKYDVVLCPKCGFAALSRFFQYVTANQKKAIVEKISKNFKAPRESEIYTYEEAVERYKMALLSAIVKNAKASEKAYICLKTGWLIRSWSESLNPSMPGIVQKKQELLTQENAFLNNALDGFISARQSEAFPMCGMDEMTVDYLIAALSVRFERFEVASKMIAGILGSVSANPRMKDKARDLKEIVMKKMKENKE